MGGEIPDRMRFILFPAPVHPVTGMGQGVARASRPVQIIRPGGSEFMGRETHARSNPNYGVLSRAWRTWVGVTVPWSPPQRVRT